MARPRVERASPAESDDRSGRVATAPLVLPKGVCGRGPPRAGEESEDRVPRFCPFRRAPRCMGSEANRRRRGQERGDIESTEDPLMTTAWRRGRGSDPAGARRVSV